MLQIHKIQFWCEEHMKEAEFADHFVQFRETILLDCLKCLSDKLKEIDVLLKLVMFFSVYW